MKASRKVIRKEDCWIVTELDAELQKTPRAMAGQEGNNVMNQREQAKDRESEHKDSAPTRKSATPATAALSNTDLINRAEAEDRKRRRLSEYKAWRGVKEYRGPCYLNRLVGERHAYQTPHRWIDHPSMWTKNGKPYAFVSQPYVLTLDAVAEIVRYCREHNLDLWIDAERSWYLPGYSLLVELRRREDE